VAVFLPLQPVAGAALAFTFLGTSIRCGTLIGGVVIAMGLVAVTAGRAAGARRNAGLRREQTGRMSAPQVGALKMKAAKGGPWIYDLTLNS